MPDDAPPGERTENEVREKLRREQALAEDRSGAEYREAELPEDDERSSSRA